MRNARDPLTAQVRLEMAMALAGIAACLAVTTYYLAEYSSYPRARPQRSG